MFRAHAPRSLADVARAYLEFGRAIIEIAAPLVPVIKPQAAFFEACGPQGCQTLQEVLRFAEERGMVTILDGKRNDIGSTAAAYAEAYLGRGALGSDPEHLDWLRPWSADALTINPYLGSDGIVPFVEIAAREGRGLFALVRTSNPSAREFQDLIADGRPVYRHVAEKVLTLGEAHRGFLGYSLLGAVVGATYPSELAELRQAMPGVYFLVPGYGSQGAKAADVAAAFDPDGLGAIVNNSRGLIFAHERPDLQARNGNHWERSVECAIHEMIDALASETPCGRLRD